MPETRATLRYLRTSPSKVRQVLGLIRGLEVDRARDVLRFSERGPSLEVGKLLDSAIANAEHNENIPEDELYVVRAWADEGPTMKRWRPRARGRGTRIRKRTSHVTIVVARFTDEELERRRRVEAESEGGRRRARRRRTPRAERTATGASDESVTMVEPDTQADVDADLGTDVEAGADESAGDDAVEIVAVDDEPTGDGDEPTDDQPDEQQKDAE